MNTVLINFKGSSLKYLFIFITLLGSIGCQKEISKDTLLSGGGGGTSSGSAQFSLVPSGANCSDAMVTGTFQAGAALGADAVLTVTVNVTKTGDWMYSTALLNGFVFAGAGNFTATGSQVISLQATGKPIAAGTTDFKLAIGGANCTISATVDNSGGTTGEFYYKATIDGVNYTQSVTATNGYEPGVSMGGLDDVVFGGGINYANPPTPAGKTAFGVEKGVMHQYISATQAQFKAFFSPGDYSYAPLSYSDGDGISIGWTDTKGEDWQTRDGKTDQPGSTFKIISAQDWIDAVGDYYLKVKVQFNCKLYNVNTGAMKTVTNGEAVVAFGMF